MRTKKAEKLLRLAEVTRLVPTSVKVHRDEVHTTQSVAWDLPL